MSSPYAKLPAWADYGLIPLVNLAVAFVVAGLVVFLVGENPLRAAVILVEGAFGRGQGIAFTLFYATTFIFSGLSVAVAFLLHWLVYWLASRIVRRMRIEPVILPALYHPSRWLIVLMTLAAGIQPLTFSPNVEAIWSIGSTISRRPIR